MGRNDVCHAGFWASGFGIGYTTARNDFCQSARLVVLGIPMPSQHSKRINFAAAMKVQLLRDLGFSGTEGCLKPAPDGFLFDGSSTPVPKIRVCLNQTKHMSFRRFLLYSIKCLALKSQRLWNPKRYIYIYMYISSMYIYICIYAYVYECVYIYISIYFHLFLEMHTCSMSHTWNVNPAFQGPPLMPKA